MKKLLLSLFILLGNTSVFAQYVKNPSFEDGLKDWKYLNLETKDNRSFKLLDGDLFLEKWVSSSNQVGDFNLEQTITDLPLGEYKLTIAAQNAKESTPNVEQKGAWIFANDFTKPVWKVDDYSLTIVVFDGTLTIGFRGEGATGNWVACDNVRLELTSTEPDAIRAGFLKEIEALEAYLTKPMYDEDKADLQTVINQARELYESGSLEGIPECVAMLHKAAKDAEYAIRDYEVENTDDGKPLDVTKYIVNPSFESGTTGWTVKSMSRQNNGNFKKTKGSWYMDKWNSSSAAGSFSIEQTVTDLPVGEYTLTIAAQNTKQSAPDTKQTGAWIFANNQKTTVEALADYSVKAVIVAGELSIGFKGENATGNWVACDNVRLVRTSTDLELLRPAFLKEIEALEAYLGKDMYDEDKAKVQATVDAARQLYEANTIKGMSRCVRKIRQAIADAEDAIYRYNIDHANPDEAYEVTSLITNPSFEDGTTGWVCDGMKTQTNNSFTIKHGSAYLESWLPKGNRLGDCSALQTLKNLPVGRYQLKVNALHVGQGSSETSNTGSPQTGANLVAGTSRVVITAMKTYTVNFVVPEENISTQIGVIAEGATGNWICVDKFQMFFLGPIQAEDRAADLQKMIDNAKSLLKDIMQQDALTQLTTAITAAETAVQGTGTDGEGNTTYDEAAMSTARATLQQAVEEAQASHARYTTLTDRLTYAKKVAKWWKNSERRATNLALLNTAITTAEAQTTDTSLSTDQLTTAVNNLNERIAAVDKGIYCSGSACGSRTQLQDDNNQWSFLRSLQSKHWIVFWEKGYGTKVPANVENMLNMADECFELYANKLGFIKAEQGTSKTDKYKMIIRLKSTGDWIAEGSGIDNQIGMLTLSSWGYQSRGGQTTAHEIGHCFQYQVHCDNGDWKGWMFNWHESTQNPFWEMCAQWMAYVYLPNKLFNDNEWLNNSLNGMHRHPLAGYLRYENMFIQNLFVEKHGWDAVGRLWNDCDYGEDPFETYMRTRMTGTKTQKLNQLADELWEWGARMTTYDFESIRELGKNSIGKRNQTKLTKDSKGFWSPEKGDCIENYGNNAIKLNIPSKGKTAYAEFVGEAGKSGYTAYNVEKAGWKYGFVALLNDGTRIYTPITTSTYDNPSGIVEFESPGNIKNFWFVVSGAPTSYWARDLINWGESTAEQWPYKVKFYQTNVYGNTNNNGVPTGINDIIANESSNEPNVIYDLQGRRVSESATKRGGLYIINGRKIVMESR